MHPRRGTAACTEAAAPADVRPMLERRAQIGSRRWRRTAVRAPSVVAIALLACAAPRPELPAQLQAWPQGPVHWLLLSEEVRAYRRVHGAAEAETFIAAFWTRREAVEGSGGSSFQHRFEERVALADAAYSEGQVRGSLTDRGAALILLGPPVTLRSAPRKPPAGPLRRQTAASPALLTVEVWGYPPAQFPRVVALKPALGGRRELTVEFFIERGHATLAAGRDLLVLAARAAAGEQP